jgi:hypothetical protein
MEVEGMDRRRGTAALLFTVLVGLLAPCAAAADVAPPPVLLHVEGQDAALTTVAPDRAEFLIRNVSPEAIGVYLFRIVVLDGSTRVPVDIDRIEIDGRPASGRNVSVPANGQLRVVAYFTLPRHLHGRRSYDVDLSIRQEGFGDTRSTPATIARRGAHARTKWAVRPR